MTGESAPAGAATGAGSAVLLSLRGVAKTFANGTVALAGLDMDIRRGEFLSLLGPSGCGKSTALRIISRLAEPTGGTIEWPGSTVADHAADIGFVFQEPTLMPWATVADNVCLPMRLKGRPKEESAATADKLLALVGLSGFARAYPRELSGGMKMRVSIARALMLRPALLLMDEPFAALDEITRFKLNDDLLRLKTEVGCTVVFVTHSVYESVYLSTRIVVMAARPGRVVRDISVDEPLPREASFRSSALYVDSCKATSEALHGAMGAHEVAAHT